MNEMETGTIQEPLLSPDFLEKLEHLRLVARKITLGTTKGERRSRRRGSSVEFADYRDYVRGDDLRFLDWNIYGRLDRLFIKLFHEEEDLHVYVLLDRSRSMDYGEPNKFLQARRFAAALAYIALMGMDRVGIGALSMGRFEWFRPTRGPGQIAKIIRFLEPMEAVGETHLEEGTLQFRVRQTRPGIILLVSDFFDPHGYEESLRILSQGKNEVFAVQILSPDEMDPDLMGALRLLDLETNEPVEISVSGELIRIYRNRLAAYEQQIGQFCARRGIHHLVIRSDADLAGVISASFRKLGLVK
ncbi:MAG TPA: DUF58 domain-containing protein [bacterium]|nr:DUF58 domain-containing protein [bacterium]HQQ00435.1 DUF58 domain-containing protein [bacterium]